MPGHMYLHLSSPSLGHDGSFSTIWLGSGLPAHVEEIMGKKLRLGGRRGGGAVGEGDMVRMQPVINGAI